MNFKKRVNGSWTDTPHYIHNTSTDTITTLPAVVYPNDTTATVGLKGQATQSGTPTPDNPIMPEGCGNKTANFCSLTEGYLILINNVRFTVTNGLLTINGTANGSGGRVNKLSPVFTLPAGTYYISFTNQVANFTAYVNKNSDNTVIGYSSVGNFTLAEDTEVYIGCNVVSGKEYDATIGIMLNTGSTAKPYEPYGIKIPISSGDTTTPVYLGEVETTRKIRKLVLDGSEPWIRSSNIVYINNKDVMVLSPLICTHFPNVKNTGMWNGNTWIFQVDISNLGMSGRDAWISYLQQQYAAGTPVCVWYVLAEPETGIVNEPLMRIGDYADTLSNVSIPVTAGGDTLSVDTTVQPSEVTVNYKGWHPVSDVHEKSKNLFDKDRTNGIVDNSYINISGGTSTDSSYYISYPIYLTVGETYTWRFDNVLVHSAPTIGFYDNSNNLMGVAPHDTIVTNFSFTVPSGCAYVKCSVYKILRSEAMLNSGSTALPYEPYWT